MLYEILIILSLILTMLGGWCDINDDDIEIGCYTISKQHLWNDAKYLLLLVISLKVISYDSK